MRIVFIHAGDVVVDRLSILEHSTQAIVNDHREFIHECRVIRHTGRDGRSQYKTVPVLVLQPFTGKGCSTRSATHEKTAGFDVGCGPGKITDALEPEHRIENVERDHVDAMIACGSPGSDP